MFEKRHQKFVEVDKNHEFTWGAEWAPAGADFEM
jgi:hypothetical protein